MSPSSSPLRVIILAAGRGHRLKSQLPKVLHPLAGFPLLGHVVKTAQQLRPQEIVVVTCPQLPQVDQFLTETFPQGLKIAHQDSPQGTGHAVLCARPSLSKETGDVLILYGDAPLVTPATLKEMEGIKKSDPQVRAVVLGMESQDTQSYGRLITRPGAPQELERIVELKDATPEERQVTLCNSGIMLVTGSDLFTLLEQVQPSPHTQEYYLTDIVKGMKTLGGRCLTVKGPQSELAGINTRSELMAAEAWIQDRYRRQVLEGGATLRGAETVFFSHDTQVASDVIIEPHVVFAPGVILEEGCHILSFSHLADTRVGPGAHIGPFARLRGKTTVASQGEVGNFVEVKNTTVGKGAKIKHLSYVGDAQVGEKANIGAGAITANYDGTAKWHTHIGAGAMIGVNSVLIAPVTIGEKAMVAAGSVITKEVGPQDLAIGRVRQENHPNRALSLREKYEKRKKERQ